MDGKQGWLGVWSGGKNTLYSNTYTIYWEIFNIKYVLLLRFHVFPCNLIQKYLVPFLSVIAN